MKHGRTGLLAALLAVGGPAQADTVKLAVVIGNNVGHDPARALRYAENDARKVYQVLTELGEFEPGHVRLLTGRGSTEVWKAIQQTEEHARALRGRPGRQIMLVIYYSGHADGSVLELGSSSLRYDALTELLRTSRADVRVAFVDSCRSGQLVAMKGGRRGEPFRIQVADEVSSRGFAVITSSAADELSQESVEVRGSFFTHYLVSALRGAADQSADGKVTLSEAYRYAYGRTVARTSATIGGSQHPMYDFKLAGHGDIVLTSPARAGGLLVSSSEPGRVLVLDARAETMVAEGQVAANHLVRLALAPGKYQVLLLEKGRLGRASLVLAPRQSVRLVRGDFVAEPMRPGVAKGEAELFTRAIVHRLSAGLLMRRMPLAGTSLSLGAAVEYQIEPWAGWRLLGRLGWTTSPDSGVSTGYHDFGGMAGAAYGWALRLPVVFSLLAGYELMRQDDRDGARYSSAFSYLGTIGLEVPIGELLLQATFGAGGRVFRLREQEDLVHRLDLQLLVGAGWRWGG